MNFNEFNTPKQTDMCLQLQPWFQRILGTCCMACLGPLLVVACWKPKQLLLILSLWQITPAEHISLRGKKLWIKYNYLGILWLTLQFPPKKICLVVYLPLWKIWVRPLGLLFQIYGKTEPLHFAEISGFTESQTFTHLHTGAHSAPHPIL